MGDCFKFLWPFQNVRTLTGPLSHLTWPRQKNELFQKFRSEFCSEIQLTIPKSILNNLFYNFRWNSDGLPAFETCNKNSLDQGSSRYFGAIICSFWRFSCRSGATFPTLAGTELANNTTVNYLARPELFFYKEFSG